jgi:hypothetical protein
MTAQKKSEYPNNRLLNAFLFLCNVVELEKELGTVFYPVSKIITMNIRIPVVVRVGQEHLQVTTVSSNPLLD